MAIDMIEENELSALGTSRLGNRQFIDDMYVGRYAKKEDFANLFGSKKRKESIANVKTEQNARWAKLPVDSCDDIKNALASVAIEIEKLTKQSASSDAFYILPGLEVAREWEGKFKQMQASKKCLELEAEAKKQAERELTLQTLTQLSDTTVEKAKSDLAQTQGTSSAGLLKSVSNLTGGNKTMLYAGAIGVGALLLFLLVRKR